MNKRNRTYFLIGLAVVVWLGVIYRLVAYLTPNKENNSSLKDIPTQASIVKKTEKRLLDTSKMHYRDPFGVSPKKTKKSKINSARKSQLLPADKKLPFPVVYLGFVKSKKSIFFSISIKSKQYLIKKGEKIEDIKLLSGNSKFIKITYHSKVFTVKR